MSTYLIQFNFSQANRKDVVANPQDRRPILGKLLESTGGKLQDMWFSWGEWDVVALAEFPADIDAKACAFAADALGGNSRVSITPLVSHDEGVKAMRMAHEVTSQHSAMAEA